MNGQKRPIGGVILATLGGVMLAGAVAVVGALVLALLFWQLLANIVMVPFKQDLHWYGDSVYTAGGDLWWYVAGSGAVGAALLAAGASMLAKAGAPLKRPGASADLGIVSGGGVSERPKEHASKACDVQASVGSNPTATASPGDVSAGESLGMRRRTA